MTWHDRRRREREQQIALDRQREAAVLRRLPQAGRTVEEVHSACLLAAAITPGSSCNVTLAALRRLRDRGEVHERDGVWYPGLGLGPTPPQGSRVGAPAPGGGETSSPAPGATAGPMPSAATSHPPALPSDDPRPTAPDQDGPGVAGTDQAEDLAGGSSPPAEVVTGHGVETARPPSASHPPEVPVSLADRVVAAVRACPGRSCTAIAEELHAWPAQVAKVSRTDPRIRRVARPRSNAWDLHPAELPPPSLLSPPSPLDLPGESTAASGGGLPSSSPSSDTPPAPTDAGAGSSPAGTSGGDLVDDTPLRPAGLPSPEVAPVPSPVPDPCPVPPPGRSVDVEDQVGALLGLEEGVSDEELVEAVAELRVELQEAHTRSDRHLVRVGELEAQVRTLQLELDAVRVRAEQAEAAARIDATVAVYVQELFGADEDTVLTSAWLRAGVQRIREPLEAALGGGKLVRGLTLSSLADEAERVIGELRTRAEQHHPTVDEVALELLSELRDRAEASGLRVPRCTNPAVLIAYLTGWLEASGSITAPVPPLAPLAPVSVLDGAPVSAGA